VSVRQLAMLARGAKTHERTGLETVMWRSNRPGRVNAASRVSGRLVAASTIMPSFDSKPSISTRSWLRVFLLHTSRAERRARGTTGGRKTTALTYRVWLSHDLRLAPMASISSMNTMHGVCNHTRAAQVRAGIACCPDRTD
jgi:hypothetical protein